MAGLPLTVVTCRPMSIPSRATLMLLFSVPLSLSNRSEWKLRSEKARFPEPELRAARRGFGDNARFYKSLWGGGCLENHFKEHSGTNPIRFFKNFMAISHS